MKLKVLITAVILCLPMFVLGQDIYFKSGLNLTNYQFKDINGKKAEGLISDIGSSYEIGFGLPLPNEWFKYELGIALDSYNSTGGDFSNSYSWNTNYGGIKNTLSFLPTEGEFNYSFFAVGAASTIINGNQVINTSRYELTSHPDFKGILLQTGLGLSASYNIFNQGFISLQYDFTKSFKVGEKTVEKLSFLNNRILLGIHFNFY
jgi:hypothetical protein